MKKHYILLLFLPFAIYSQDIFGKNRMAENMPIIYLMPSLRLI